MFKYNGLSKTICLGLVVLAVWCSSGQAQGDFNVSLEGGVVADPGQIVALGVIVVSSDSVAGLDVLLGFDPDLLSFSSFELLRRFQYVDRDDSQAGKLRLILRRHDPDSTGISALNPGTDTLGLVWLGATSRDLLMDVEVAVLFYDDTATPYDDNRLVRTDSSFVTPPELQWVDGSVFIRHALYGDVNGDGYAATVADIVSLANYLAGSQSLTSRQRANADVNRDGFQATIADLTELIRVVAEE